MVAQGDNIVFWSRGAMIILTGRGFDLMSSVKVKTHVLIARGDNIFLVEDSSSMGSVGLKTHVLITRGDNIFVVARGYNNLFWSRLRSR